MVLQLVLLEPEKLNWIALAVKALKNKNVKRIILTRPAIEAGENLGFCLVI